MKLFINSEVCARIWTDIKIIQSIDKSRLCLQIPNFLEEEQKKEKIKFVFNIEGINQNSFNKNLLLDNISLRKTSKNTYNIYHSKRVSERYMYALIRNPDFLPNDLYIPSYMKDEVKVLRRMCFFDNYGLRCLSNVYLIKVDLSCNLSIPIYFSSNHSRLLSDHYVFYKFEGDNESHITERLRTWIFINEYNKYQYISLSELCN